MNMNEVIKSQILNSKKKRTMLGIGPMSPSLILASLELAQERNFPVMYIASRNQVDADEFGCGYVNNWNAERFVKDIANIAKSINFTGKYYICRDHGGPWQRDMERNEKLPRKQAMEIAKKSYTYDIKAGFDLLHIDPTKIPDCGEIAPIEDVLDMTVELIRYCEAEKKRLHKTELFYEVGTEETNGGLTSPESFEYFIQNLLNRLDLENLTHPSFIVGQTGTLVRMTSNVGSFNACQAKKLAEIAAKYGMGLKEHNCDYIPDCDLAKHPILGVTASNVAPEYGYVETCALLDLCQVEEMATEQGLIEHTSNFYKTILKEAIKCGRWEKWLQTPADEKQITNDKTLSKQILYLAGHYTFNEAIIKEQRNILYSNLELCGIDPNRYVINHLKSNLDKYVTAFNLEGMLK